MRHVPALLAEPGEHVVDVADQLDLGDEVLVDLGRHRVDADDLLVALRVPVLGRVLDQVVADRQHQVGLVEAGHAVVARLQADRAERLRRCPAASSPLPMNVSATGMPVARTNSRSAGAALARTTPLPASATGLIAPRTRSAARSSSRAAGSERIWRVRGSGCGVDLLLHHVLGQLDVRGARLLALGELERLAHDLGDDRGVGQARVPLGDRAHHAQQVDVLVRLLVHALEVALAGQRHQRRAVEVGVRDGRDEVERARAERSQADAGVPGQAPVDVGHVGAALLVAYRDELDRRVRQRLVEVEGLLPRDAEYVLDALGLEALNEDVGCLAGGHGQGRYPRPVTSMACRRSPATPRAGT